MPRSASFTDDPPPFDLVEGSAASGVVVLCDHASATVPACYGDLGLDREALASHVAWDIGAAAVARGLAARLGCPAVLGGVSRLVVDCNRAPGEAGFIPAATCGVTVPGNAAIGVEEALRREEAWFRPYHRAIAAAIAHARACGSVPALVSVHSFTPAPLGGRLRPWHVGVLWNRDGRLALPLIERLGALPGVVVGDNQPYSGREINYTLDTHGGAAGLPHVSVELRQDLVADAAATETWADRLAEALSPLLADPRLHSLAT